MDHIGRWNIPVLERGDAPGFEAYFRDLAGVLADVAKDNQGTLAARPVSTPLNPGVAGRYWYVTGDPTPANNARLYRDFGTGWLELRTGTAQAAALTAQAVGEVGAVAQVRAGRALTVADFTAMGLAAPLALWNLADVTDASGNARHLTNKGAVPFAPGILGLAGGAAQFAGSTAQALYRADTGAADPFRIRTGSFGCWFRTAKRGVAQYMIAKLGTGAPAAWGLFVSNTVQCSLWGDGAASLGTLLGVTDVADDRWHFAVVTHDGTRGRLYVDGALEHSVSAVGTLNVTTATAPLNIGGYLADAATAATNPHYGRVDEAFITADVLTDEHQRNLYAASVPHALGAVPSSVRLAVRRRRRGAALVGGDFPAAPLRLYNFPAGAVANEGTDANGAAGGTATLLPNPGTGAIVDVAGPDGSPGAAKSFSGAHTGLSGTDTGLPAGTAARSYGAWFKCGTVSATALGWGTLGTGDARLVVSAGSIQTNSGADALNGPRVDDGLWHFGVVVEDNAAADGVKRKLYLDGRLVNGSTVLTAIVLAGANRFRVGAAPDGTGPFVGQAARPFVYAGALTGEQVRALYNKGAAALAASPKSEGDHVEAMEADRLLVVLDSLEAPDQVDMAVIA